MAYDPKQLSVLAYANGFTLWHYRTDDTATAVGTSGYFNLAADMLRDGDMLLVNCSDRSSVLSIRRDDNQIVAGGQ